MSGRAPQPIGIGQEVEVNTISGMSNIAMIKTNFSRAFNPITTTPKPSLLRRARPAMLKQPRVFHVPAAPSAASSLPPASAGFIQRSTVVNIPSEIQMHSQQFQTEGGGIEEIELWEPDTEECEVVEVDESELVELFQQRSHPDNNIQQIIVCDGDNVPFVDYMQNYVLEVVEQPQLQTQQQEQQASASSAAIKPKPKRPSYNRAPSGRKKVTTELKCLEEECQNISHNVIELRKHLQNDHEMEFDEELRQFESDQEFKTWRTNYERTRRVSFIYRGGTKKISTEKAVTYMICHRSGYYKPTIGAQTERKRKLKPQGSCKIGTHCTAGIKLLKNLKTGLIDATICHTHYGHDNENIQHLRLNPVVKGIVVNKLDEGYTFAQLLEYVHHNPDGVQGMGVVDRRAIRNIFDHWRKNKAKLVKKEDEGSESDDTTSTKDKNPKVVVKSEPRTDGEPCDEGNESGGGNDNKVENSNEAEIDKTEEETDKDKSNKVEKPDDENENEESDSADKEEYLPSSAKSKSRKAKPGRKSSTKRSTARRAPPRDTSEDIYITIDKLLKHGDSGPSVLYYKKPGKPLPEYGEKNAFVGKDELCIIVQTPIQRQLLQMNAKILDVEVLEGYDVDVLVVSILDEFLMSIPVAWMITSSTSPKLVEHFFRTLQRNCVQIDCRYFVTPKRNDFIRLWGKVFRRLPRLILPQEDTLRELRLLMRRHLTNNEDKEDIHKLLQEMVMTPDPEVFEENLESLTGIVSSADFLSVFHKEWIGNKKKWAFHQRTQVHPAVEESFTRLKKFILFKGTKKMKENVHNMLKIGYDRCFQRSKSLFKGDLKMQLTMDEIQAKHGGAATVEKYGDNKYIVDSTHEVFDLETACVCRIRCDQCQTCIHNYWCSCGDKNFCAHAHTVHQFRAGNFIIKCEEESDVEVPDSPLGSEGGGDLEDDLGQDENDDLGKVENDDDEDEFEPSPERTPSPELIVPETTPSSSKRVSARIRERKLSRTEKPLRGKRGWEVLKEEPEEEVDEDLESSSMIEEAPSPPKRGRGRPRKFFVQASEQIPASKPPVKSSPVGETLEKKESVREELLGLLGKLDNIHDSRVMTEVKKRVSDISAVVHLGFN